MNDVIIFYVRMILEETITMSIHFPSLNEIHTTPLVLFSSRYHTVPVQVQVDTFIVVVSVLSQDLHYHIPVKYHNGDTIFSENQ